MYMSQTHRMIGCILEFAHILVGFILRTFIVSLSLNHAQPSHLLRLNTARALELSLDVLD